MHLLRHTVPLNVHRSNSHPGCLILSIMASVQFFVSKKGASTGVCFCMLMLAQSLAVDGCWLQSS